MAGGVTLTGTLTDPNGNGVAGIVTLVLCNYPTAPPTVTSTSNFVQTTISTTAASNGTFSVTFYGNYQISPPNTYYQITWQIPGYATGIMESTLGLDFQFMTAGTFNLANLVPFVPGGLPVPIISFDEVPSGTINGTNPTFTLNWTPLPQTSLNLFVNGSRATAGIAYTLAGNVITYASLYIPHIGDTHICNYVHF